WQTHETQNLALCKQRGGSTPPSSTSAGKSRLFASLTCWHLASRTVNLSDAQALPLHHRVCAGRWTQPANGHPKGEPYTRRRENVGPPDSAASVRQPIRGGNRRWGGQRQFQASRYLG